MSEMKVTGKLVGIKPTEQRGQYFVRPFLLDISNVNSQTGQVYENMLMLEFWGDKCSKLDGFQAGQTVSVSYNLRGSKDKTTQKWRWVNLNPWKIELVQPVQTTPNPAPVAKPVPQAQQNWSNQNTQTTTQVAPAPDITQIENDDLPF